MKFRPLALFVWTCLVAGAAIASEQRRVCIEIALDEENAGGRSFDTEPHERIRETLQRAGKPVEIRSIGSGESDADRGDPLFGSDRVRVIRTEVHVTNQIPRMLFVS